MNYEEWLKQNPEYAARQKAKENIQKTEPITDDVYSSSENYHCPNCGFDFDKPANQSSGWGAFICGIVLAFIGISLAPMGMVPGIGMVIIISISFLTTILFLIFSIAQGITSISPRKICPYCKWPYIVRMK